MSGMESLIPFIGDKKKGEEPTIVVDTREASSAKKVVKCLVEKGVTIKTQVLDKGDYVISDQCAVERKTVNDFVYTLTRRYLFEQLFLIKNVYSKVLLVLEGYLPVIYKYSSIQPQAVWGAMFNLAKNGIAIVNTGSYKETADFLYTAAKQEKIVEKRSTTVHAYKKTETLADTQIYFMASLPNIGWEKATTLLNEYQTPINALINVEQWSKTVNGLGPIITNKVKEVLSMPYKESKQQPQTQQDCENKKKC
jgi:Fanconi anemia group M protein